MAISTADGPRRPRDELLRLGLQVTDIRDRCYVESIYFREPGGVLFEVATINPGFTADEETSSLGHTVNEDEVACAQRVFDAASATG